MNPIQAGRRSFLCNIGILATGVAFGGVNENLFSVNKDGVSLEVEWKNFCKQNDAVPFTGLLSKKRIIAPCKGHEHKEGKLVYFSKYHVIAQPVWIYWANDRNKSADVVVNFYNKTGNVVTLNQYELKALNKLNKQTSKYTESWLDIIFKVDETQQRILYANTSVKNNETITRLHIHKNNAGEEITYNI